MLCRILVVLVSLFAGSPQASAQMKSPDMAIDPGACSFKVSEFTSGENLLCVIREFRRDDQRNFGED